jgi:hypothetical protein
MIDNVRFSRRTMVGSLAAVGTIAAVGMVAQKGAVTGGSNSLARALLGSARGPASLAAAEMEGWQAAVGTNFSLAGSLNMRLVGVRPLASAGARPSGLRRRAFIAIFELPAFAQLPGDLIYTLANSTYGRLDLLLAETAGRGAQRLQAVLN